MPFCMGYAAGQARRTQDCSWPAGLLLITKLNNHLVELYYLDIYQELMSYQYRVIYEGSTGTKSSSVHL